MTPKTRRKTEFCRLLSYRQSFVKSIGVFPGPRSTSLKKHAVLRELRLKTLRNIALPATTVFDKRSLCMHLLHRETCSNFRDMIKVVFFVTWSRCLLVTKNLKSMISPKFMHVCRCSNLPYFRCIKPKLLLVKNLLWIVINDSL